MFCAIATTIERCKTEGVVDVFQVVKALRVQKPGAVRTVVSYDYDGCSLLVSCMLYLLLHSPHSVCVCVCIYSCSTRSYLRQFSCISTLLLSTPTFSRQIINFEFFGHFLLSFVYLYRYDSNDCVYMILSTWTSLFAYFSTVECNHYC